MPDTRDITEFISYLIGFVEGIKITEDYGIADLIDDMRTYFTDLLISGIRLLNQHKDERLHFKLLALAERYARRPNARLWEAAFKF